eukprot:gene27450-33851_t
MASATSSMRSVRVCSAQTVRKISNVTKQLSARNSMAGASVRSAVFNVNSSRAVSARAVTSPSCSLATLVKTIEDKEMKEDLMDFRVGYEVKCNVTVTEGNKTRVQPFQGIIISMHKAGNRSTITVRKMVQGVGVERVFPIHSPLITFESVPGSGTPK